MFKSAFNQPLQRKPHEHSKALFTQKGIALITVLLITAIAAIVGTQITANQNRTANRTVQLINSDQGVLNIWSMENFAKIYLVEDIEESSADFPGEDWTIHISVPVDGGAISGKLIAETAKYNINNIIDDKGKIRPVEGTRLLRLFEKLNIENAGELISAIIDWIDKDSSVYQEIRPFKGAEDSYYTILPQPYRTSNRPLLDVSELRLVKGMTPKIFNKIKPFLTALPGYTSVNANFAKSEVIAMLDEDITPESISEILKRQNKKDAFKSHSQLIGEIQNHAKNTSASTRLSKILTANVIDVKTNYFRLNASVYLSKSKTHASSILYRKDKKIQVRWRQFGLWE